MKRILFLILILCLITLLPSCAKSANMTDLTQYQNEDFLAEVKISCNNQSIFAKIERSGSTFKLHIASDDMPDDTFFYFTDDSTFIQSGDTAFPFSPGASPLLSHITKLFSLSTADIWKIEKATLSGVSVYKCENGYSTIYVDACSRLPLKIQQNEISVDILSFSQSE